MRSRRSWQLRPLLIILATIALLPLVLSSGWAIRTTMQQHRTEVERSALDLSRALATAVGTELESTVASLRILSQSQALVEGKLPDFYKIAVSNQQSHPSWQSVVLTDAEGRLLFSTAHAYGTRVPGIVDPESLRQVIESERAVVGSARVGPLGNLAFPVRVPVYRDRKLTYVLSAAVAPEPILAILRQQKVPGEWVVAVFDASGKRVARTKRHDSGAPSVSLARLLAEGGSEGVGITTTLEGVESVTGFSRVAGHRWTVAVGVPTPGMGHFFSNGPVVVVIGVAASVLAWLLAASWLSQRIAGAVDRLKQRASALIRESKVLEPVQNSIREIEEADTALVELSRERAAVEAERQRLNQSLTEALTATRLALSQAEAAGLAKDNFLAMLGHEMRNPLAPIVSALDLLDLKGDQHSAAERAIMRRQLDRLRLLVDDILDVSRIVQGKLQVVREALDLRQVIRNAEQSVRRAAEADGTTLEMDLPDGPVPVAGDAGRLEQAFTNLITNANRFATGGKIRVQLRQADESAVVVVDDDGLGMDDETLGKLFQPFFQAPQTLARSRGGLGLGLSIVKTIVELHGGRVRAFSDGIGKGSRFEIRLPIAPTIAAPVLELEPATNRGEGRRILVVDDNVDAADLIAAGLQSAGNEVQVAYSGERALALMDEFQPEVTVLDIGMPDMDGYELARAIRRRDPDWKGQLVALSGYGLAADKELARAAGFDHHLTKPARLAELQSLITAGNAHRRQNVVPAPPDSMNEIAGRNRS